MSDEFELEDALSDVFEEYAAGLLDDDALYDAVSYLQHLAFEFFYDPDEFWEIAGRAASNANVHGSASQALGFG